MILLTLKDVVIMDGSTFDVFFRHLFVFKAKCYRINEKEQPFNEIGLMIDCSIKKGTENPDKKQSTRGY